MIAETDIEIALKKHVDDGALTYPIAWPNQEFSPARPYIMVDLVRVNRRDDTMDNAHTISRGQLIATVVVNIGTSTRTANEKADAIAALFPMGLRIAVTGGNIVILKPADIREGFRQDADWRVPVIVDYEAS